MAKGATKPGFYAVKVGRIPGIYTTWDETVKQVEKYPKAIHKKFPTKSEAEAFLSGTAAPPPTSTKRSREDEDRSSGRGKEKVFRKEAGDKLKGRVVYCDGSSLGNGKKGATAGSGVFWGDDEELQKLNIAERLPGRLQTNNRAEMYAIARILETDPHPSLPLTICTDSEYSIGAFSTWIPGWKARNWRTYDGKPVQNKDLIQYVLALLALRPSNVVFKKVKAHVGIEGNERADRFAKEGAEMIEVEDRDFMKETRELEKRLKAGEKKVQDEGFEVDLGVLTIEELEEMEKTQNFD